MAERFVQEMKVLSVYGFSFGHLSLGLKKKNAFLRGHKVNNSIVKQDGDRDMQQRCSF